MLRRNEEKNASTKCVFVRDYRDLKRMPGHPATSYDAHQHGLERFRTALLGGAALLTLLGAGQAAHAQTVVDSGTVTVPGDHSSPWNIVGTLVVGDTGAGTLNIGDGGTPGVVTSDVGIIGQNPGSQGRVTVDGAGSRWDSNDLTVGKDGQGLLTIKNGATVNNGAAVIGFASGLPFVSGSAGSVSLQSNSTWNVAGNLYVGRTSTGLLGISGGASATSFSATLGDTATGDGTVAIDGAGSRWHVEDTLRVGGLGAGYLAVSNGGALESGDTNIGQEVNSHGTLELTGPGTSWTTTGFVNIGNKGTGELLISGGAVATTTSNTVAVGQLGDGAATVTGAGSAWHTNTLAVGATSGSSGLLTIAQGGTVASDIANIGFQDGSIGTVKLQDAGSSWSVGNQFAAGGDGTADLTISNGGSLLVGTNSAHADAYLGKGSSSATNTALSSATVAGTNSSWTTFGSLYVGDYAKGQLNITNGASVTVSNNLVLGQHSSAFGAVILNGPGSNLSIGQSLFVGGVGASTGAGGLVIADGAAVTVANGAGIVNIGMGGNSSSALFIGDAGTPTPGSSAAAPGTLNAAEVFIGQNSEAIFSHTSSNYSFAPKFSGVGRIGQVNGTTILTADSSAFNGSTIVNGGALIVDGKLGGAVDVNAGAALGGSGALAGAASILSGGKLLGAQGQTLTMNSLALDGGATIDVALGAPGNSAGLFKVNGNLVLDGTLNVTDAGSFGAGVYRLFDYAGALTDNGLTVGTTPNGASGSVQTSVANQVNFVAGASNAQFWNGMTTTADNTVHGGNGTWISGSTNWTDAGGSVAAPWNGQLAIFQNNPGAVTVDNSAGAISTAGMQFLGQAWMIDGNPLTLNGSGGSTAIRVGDGTAASASDYATINTILAGSSRLVKDDLGTLILGRDNSYTGGTWIKNGTLQIGDSGAAGSILGDLQNDGRLAFARSDQMTFAGNITGTGSVDVDSGFVRLTSNNSYTGGTTIANGATLSLGNAGTSGSIAGNIVNDGNLFLNRANNATLAAAISGNGIISQVGLATLTLSGDSAAFAGTTDVLGGELRVDGRLGGSLSVWNTATLGGSGAVGDVSVATGGTLAGVQGQTLTMNSLALNAGSNIDVALGAPGGAGVFKVNGSLVLDGALNVADAGGFGGGVYRLFDYGGTLTDNGLTIAALPNGTNAAVQTTVASQVNLLVDAANTRFWNGMATVPDGTIHGGSGAWIAGATNWTNSSGTISTSWGGQFGVFQNNPDKVTVDGSAGAISTTGMQFIGQGWSVLGDSITLAGQNGDTSIRVGDGSAAGASDHVTIGSVLTGASRLVKDDLGTLSLTADNSYSGGTWIKNGTLQLGNGAVNGSILGDVQNDGRLVIDRTPLSQALTMAGTITGGGSLDISAGAVLLTADNSYAGGTSIAQTAELVLGNGGTSGSIAGNVVNNGTLTFKRSDAVTFGGAISGNGDNQILGSVSLTGNSGAFSGTTTVGVGTLRVNGTIGGATQVFANGALGGTGVLTGPAAVIGGTLLGVEGQTLTTGTLTLSGGANVNVALGAPGNSAGLFTVNGDLALDGTLNVTDAGGFGIGVYRIFDYSGALTDNGMGVGVTPALPAGTTTAVQTSVSHQVNLVVADAGPGPGPDPVPTIQFWNGSTTTADGTIHGGNGLWTAGPTSNWTNAAGSAAAAWGGNFAVFQGDAGTVTVDGSAGAVATTGIQFIGQGWKVTGDAIALNGAGGLTSIRVGDATAASASDTAMIGAVLTGGSTLVKDDLGTLILTADNSYSGGTTIKHGTLQIGDGNGGASGSIPGNVVNDGVLRFARSDATTFAGAVSGAGSLQVLSGDVTLTADNSYAGGTRISAGAALGIGNGGTSGSILGNVINDGVLRFARSNAITFAGVVSGAGAVQVAAGDVTFTGDSTYAGGTRISSGASLTVGNGAASGSIQGNILNDGLLRFARSDATTFAGAVSGAGAVQLAGGDLTLTAENSYAGGTSISAGASLSVGNGGTTGSLGSGNILVGGSLAFNRSNDLILDGAIAGSGSLRQIGPGKTVLAADSSIFTGTTTIENGVLAVNGKLGGTIDIWSSGRLQGAGAVGNTVVRGTIAPGNSIGTLNVTGNIAFNTGSIYEAEVNAAGQADKIAATGTAAINGGSVRVLAGSGNYAPATTYTILTANGGRTGTFTEGVTSNLAFLDPSLSYDANNVYLTMTRNDISFQNVGVTPNQVAAGAGVESLAFGNPVYNAVLNLSAPQAQDAFDQLSGEIHASAKTVMIEDSRFIRSAVNDRIRSALDGVGASGGTVATYQNGQPRAVAANTGGPAIWGQGFGSWGHRNSDGNAARVDRSIGGFFVGADAPIFDTWRFGAVAGYSRTSFDADARQSSGTSDNYHLGLYGGTTFGDLAFRSGISYSWHDISTVRSVTIPGFADSLKGKYDAGTAQVFGDFGYRMRVANVAFEPFANLAYVHLHTDAFTEKGDAAALASPSASTSTTFTSLGLRASTTFDLGKALAKVRGAAGWRHAYGDVTPGATTHFSSGGDASFISGVPIARDAAMAEAGLDVTLSPAAVLSISYGGQFGSRSLDQTLRANFNVKF